ncbi:hypothetical protein CPB97_004767, partial [Podila verticillata]
LTRNIIREILKMAIQPPVLLDTSAKNIERMRGITHPTKLNDDGRQRTKAFLPNETQKLELTTEVEEEVDAGGKDLWQINIMILDNSSLVDTFELYADPEYQAIEKEIEGNSRFADEKVKVTAFLSDLHTIQIRKKKDAGGYEVINLEEEAKRMTEEDFEDLLNLGQKEAETVIITPNGAKRYRFNVYEGPSLNESAGNFEKNIFSVHKTLVESKAEFHQVLFTLAPGPITSTIKTIIRVCSDILSDLNPLFSFVHTKVDYPKLLAGNKQFQDSMKEKQEQFQRYITAVSFEDTQKEIAQNNKGLLELRGKIRRLDIDYKATDQVVNSAKNKEDVATRDDMDVVFEDKYTAATEPYPEIYSRTMNFEKQPRMIDKVHMICENVEIELALGGEGFNHWMIIYRRTSGAAASFVVKLYARKQGSSGNPFGETSKLAAICLQRLDLKKQLAAVEEHIRSKWHVQKEYNLLRDWISRETLPKAVMEELTKDEVYEANDTPFSKIKEIYLKSGEHDNHRHMTAKDIEPVLAEAGDYEYYFSGNGVRGSEEDDSKYEE